MPTFADDVHMEGIIENTGSGDAEKVTVELISPEGKTFKAFIGQCVQYDGEREAMLLDALDPIPGPYILIVSSPDLDRPLTKDSDFERFAGHRAAVRFQSPGAQRRTIEGTLRGGDGDVTVVDTEEGPVEVPLADIEEAHLIYDWDAEQQG